jgi:hypothetical protein
VLVVSLSVFLCACDEEAKNDISLLPRQWDFETIGLHEWFYNHLTFSKPGSSGQGTFEWVEQRTHFDEYSSFKKRIDETTLISGTYSLSAPEDASYIASIALSSGPIHAKLHVEEIRKADDLHEFFFKADYEGWPTGHISLYMYSPCPDEPQ